MLTLGTCAGVVALEAFSGGNVTADTVVDFFLTKVLSCIQPSILCHIHMNEVPIKPCGLFRIENALEFSVLL